MTASLVPGELSDEAASLSAQLGALLEDRTWRRLRRGHGEPRGRDIGSSGTRSGPTRGLGRAEQRHLRRELGAQRHEVRTRRRLAGAPLGKLLRLLAGLLASQDVAQLNFDLGGMGAQGRVGRE